MTPDEISATAALAGLELGPQVEIGGNDPALPSRLPLGEHAAVALAEVGAAAAVLAQRAGSEAGAITTSAQAGARAVISFALQRVNGEPTARTNQSNPLVRCYPCGDGRWIYLHGGFPNLAAGLARLLEIDVGADFDEVAAAVSAWDGQDLEDAVAEANLCAALVRSPQDWAVHPHGAVVSALPTVRQVDVGPELRWHPDAPRRPLVGLKVLDLTRVLAGPTCGRTLAAFGADVLQVTGPDTPNVPAFVIDTGHGKRRAFCDLRDPEQQAELRRLATRADVVVQGYRPGVVRRFGLDEESLRSDSWNGVYGSISCYGPEGPFADRAGWEQLAQVTSGIAHVEGGGGGTPAQAPAAFTDYTTGLLLAGQLMRALAGGRAASIDASLCQTAAWLLRSTADRDPAAAAGIGEPPLVRQPGEHGVVEHLPLGVEVDGLEIGWDWSARKLGADALAFD